MILLEGNQFKFNHKGYDCEISRNRLGCWCGYVHIPKEIHVSIMTTKKLLGQKLEYDICCHGGVTYECDTSEYHTIGFDCSHSMDFCPNMSFSFITSSSYINKQFAIDQCKSIVDQI